MLESGSSGSVRGVLSNEHPYRELGPEADIHRCTIWLALTLRIANGLREGDELVFA